MPFLGQTKWDQTIGRQLYDEGKSFEEIANKVGVGANVINAFALRHWPPREVKHRGGRRRHSHRPHSKPPRPLRPGESTLPPLPSLQDDPEAEARVVGGGLNPRLSGAG